MTEKQKGRLERLAHKRYERRQMEAKAALDEELRSIDVVWGMMGDKLPGRVGLAANSQQRSSYTQPRNFELNEQVESFLEAKTGRFSATTVTDELHRTRPDLANTIKRKSVANVLRRLAQEDKLKIEREGVGRRPTIYTRGLNGRPSAEEELQGTTA